MPFWLSIVLGIACGLAAIGGLLYLAVRPELGGVPPRSRWPKPDQNHRPSDYT
jgi:hypothetical protein